MRAAWSCRQGWITEQPPEEPAQLFLSNGKQCTINTQFFHFTSIFTAVLLNLYVVFQVFFYCAPSETDDHLPHVWMIFPRTMNKLQLNWVSDKPVQDQVCNKLAVWIAELVRSSRVYRTPLKEPAGTAAHHQGANRHLSGGFVSRIFSPVLFDSLLTGAPVHKGREEWSMLKLCERTDEGVPSSGSTLILSPTELSRVVRRRRGTCLGSFDGE